jgi:hypothetical protein
MSAVEIFHEMIRHHIVRASKETHTVDPIGDRYKDAQNPHGFSGQTIPHSLANEAANQLQFHEIAAVIKFLDQERDLKK